MSLQIALARIKQAKESDITKLDLSGMELTEIPSELAQLIQLTELDLSKNQLTEIKGLEALTQLTVLNLSRNQLIEISGLETLTNLSKLFLDHNQFSEIKGLEKLEKLVELFLQNNKIEEIKGLENLIQLRILYLYSNQLTEVKGLEKLAKLASIHLENNKLTKIKGIEKLIQLRALYLNENQLIDINGLENLTQLKYLWLKDNQLTELPQYLLRIGLPIKWEISAGEYCVVGNNPFSNPPPEIIQQGNDAIQEYFNQRKKTGQELLNEAKLILLGDGRSGKTSLANRLLGKDLPQETDRTQGVDIVIGAYSFPVANGQDFKINIWDFAGQDKYKTLHQLFYTESSLYVMVAESGNTAVDYDDWLQTAELFGEGSPLILVLNEFKEGIGMGSFDSNYWKKQFPELLKEVFTVNLGTKANFAKAEDYIRLLA